MVENLVLFALQKSAEIAIGILLEKFWKELLNDRNLKRVNHFLRMKILILYLDWVLQKTPLKSPPNQQEDHQENPNKS